MLQKTYKFFNQSTRQAFFERVKGYVPKSYNNCDEIDSVCQEFNLNKVYRFDLGENILGCSPIVHQFIQRMQNITPDDLQLNNYPEVIHKRIRKRIADVHNVDQNSVIISTGLDAIIDLISRVFIDPKDYYITMVPSFYLFEEYSERMGAIPVFLELDEADNYALTQDKIEELKDLIVKFNPKLVWIANPNNPTGNFVDLESIESVIKLAAQYNTFVIVDEAYIEFIPDNKHFSAIKIIEKYNNVMVLRTFSKAYGLAGMRIGYLVSSSTDIVEAMLMLRSHFPVTQLALDMASIAINDVSFINDTQKITTKLSSQLFEKLSQLKSFRFIPTSTNIFLLKNNYLSDYELDTEFKKQGIIASKINAAVINNFQYLRITIRSSAENMFLYQVCKQIDDQIVIDLNAYTKAKLKNLPAYIPKYTEGTQHKSVSLG